MKELTLSSYCSRFSKDVDTVDNTLPVILRDWLICICMILSIIIVIMIKSPIFGAVMLPLCVLFYFIQVNIFSLLADLIII